MLEQGLTLVITAAAAAALAFITNWLALIPWRRARHEHWTERARLLHPVNHAAASNLLMIPGILTAGISLAWPNDSPPWVLVAIAASLGTLLGNLPLGREIAPRIKLPTLLRQSWLNWLLSYTSWFLILGTIALMPYEFNADAFSLFVEFLGLYLFWIYFCRKWIIRRSNLRSPAPPRLQTIATETATRMHVSFRKVWLLHSPLATAYADIRNRDVLFTERLLEIAPDEEIAAICAHELGHLTESKTDRLKRSFVTVAYWPWLFLKPLVSVFGVPAYVGLVLLTMGIESLRYKISRKLEVRADGIAKDSVPESAVYARALLRLHEDNLIPAVTPRKEQTHPDLYDRMLAAGVTPDFPRPAASKHMAWHGQMLGTVFWLMIGILVIRMVGTIL